MQFYLIFTLVLLIFPDRFVRSGEGNKNKTTPKLLRKRSVVTVLLTANTSVFDSQFQDSRRFCRLFRGLKHQSKLCMRRKGLPELLNQTRTLTLRHCRSQFEYEQWNCADPMGKLFKKVYRETALMYSLTTSAFMYLVAKACSHGKLENCKCGSHGTSNSADWQWGDCADNVKHAKTFTRKFFQLGKKEEDYPSKILKYDSEIGINVVLGRKEKHCKCHGLSGSCSTKVCHIRLRPFEEIARELRSRYHAAAQAEQPNGASAAAPRPPSAASPLLYLDRSPSFCARSSGRRCADAANCATLCCSGGWSESTVAVNRRYCHCAWRKGVLALDCSKCTEHKQVLTCD